MATRPETVQQATVGHLKGVIAALVGAIPSLTFDEGNLLNGAQGDLGVRVRLALLQLLKELGRDIIETGAEFELSFNFDETDPLAMIYRSDNFSEMGGLGGGWQFTSTRPMGAQTGRFKIVSIGEQPDIASVIDALAEHGRVPEGQWLEAFVRTYQSAEKGALIGSPDASWKWLYNNVNFFPFLGSREHRESSKIRFTCGYDFSISWRWLVRVD